MKLLNEIIDSSSQLVANIGDAFDKNFTSKEELLKAKGDIISQVTALIIALKNVEKEILLTELKGNWLQRSWRPIVMLSFAVIVVYTFFIQPAFFPSAINISENLPSDFWALLKLGMGGYVIGRSGEKIAGTVTNIFKKDK